MLGVSKLLVEVFLHPPRWRTSRLQQFIHLCRLRYCEGKVFCLTTQGFDAGQSLDADLSIQGGAH